MHTNQRNERALLLALLKIEPSAAVSAQQFSGINWAVVLGLAGQALHPLLAQRLERYRAFVPADVVNALGTARHANAILQMRMRAPMRSLIGAVAQNPLDIVALKGWALANAVYPSPELRVMGDVDLWIDGADLSAAVRAAKRAGWETMWWREGTAAPLAVRDEVGLRYRHGQLMCEIHREPSSLSRRAPRALQPMFHRRRRVDINGIEICMLDLHDTLIHLSLHLADHHQFQRPLKGLVDVAYVTHTLGAEADWDLLARRCREFGVHRWVAVVLAVTNDLLSAGIPASSFAAFNVPDLEELRQLGVELVFSTASGPDTLLGGTSWAVRGSRAARRTLGIFLSEGDSLFTVPERLAKVLRRIRFAGSYRIPLMLRSCHRLYFGGGSSSDMRADVTRNIEFRRRIQSAG